MAQLFPGILYATFAAIPGWLLASVIATPALWQKPMPDLLTSLAKGAAFFYVFFAVITLIYGSLAWLALRATGMLNFVSLIVISLLPPVVYVAASLLLHGYDSGWAGALSAFGIPAVFIGVALWWFTVAVPARV